MPKNNQLTKQKFFAPYKKNVIICLLFKNFIIIDYYLIN